jgi:type IV secretion system protein VirB10
MSADETQSALAAELRLRPERLPVTRLSRRVLMALAAFAAISVSAALIWALSQGQRKSTGATELHSTENKPTPDGLSALPRDYAGLPPNVPALGPPLLGDIGHPIQNMQSGRASTDADQQRVAQETEAARTSRLFATTNVTEHAVTPVSLPAASQTEQGVTKQNGHTEAPPLDPDALLNMQDRKLAFLAAPIDRTTVSADRLTNPPSRYVVQAGAVISAALITGIRSDLPGQVTAQVTENVYDSPSGRYLLIPQGLQSASDYRSLVCPTERNGFIEDVGEFSELSNINEPTQRVNTAPALTTAGHLYARLPLPAPAEQTERAEGGGK